MKNKLRILTVICMCMASVAAIKAQTMYGLTNNNQIYWMTNIKTPSSINGPYAINGMASGQAMVALDFSSYNGTLYGLAYNSGSSEGQLYTLVLDSTSGTASFKATAVGSSASSMNLGSATSVALNYVPTYYGSSATATAYGRFNVVSSNGYSYVINAYDGSIATSSSTSPSYASGDLHSGSSAALGAMTYINSFYGADATAQFGYDMTNGSLVKWDSSSTTIIHTMTDLALTLGIGTAVSMDSWYDTAMHQSHIYMVATNLTGSSTLYEIDQNTGSISATLGIIGSGVSSWNTRSIAMMRSRNVSGTISGQLMYGLTLNSRNLISWDSYNPGTIRNDMAITGVTSGQVMAAIAFNAIDRNLYGLGYNSTAKTYQVYQINAATGAATAVNSTPYTLDLGNTDNSQIAFNFDPVNSRWHVVGTSSSNSNVNVELSNTTAAITNTDSSIAYASGDINAGANASLSAIAYSNDYKNATASTMYGIDAKTGAFLSFASGSASTMNTILNINALLSGTLGISSNNNGVMDIYYDSSSKSNMGYLAINNYGYGNSASNYANFYKVNLASGATTQEGSVGPGTPVRSMAAKKEYAGNNITYVSNVSNPYGNIVAYPNPVMGQTRIVLPEPTTTDVYVNVIDMNGRIVRNYEYGAGSYNLDLDMSNLPVGLYNARILQNGRIMQNVKLLKQ